MAGWSGAVAHAASNGVPAIPLAGATALEILGAISLLAGWKTRWGAAALVALLVPVTFVFHNFWAAHGAEVQLQMIQFLKNVAIGGGLLGSSARGPGHSASTRGARSSCGRRRLNCRERQFKKAMRDRALQILGVDRAEAQQHQGPQLFREPDWPQMPVLIGAVSGVSSANRGAPVPRP